MWSWVTLNRCNFVWDHFSLKWANSNYFYFILFYFMLCRVCRVTGYEQKKFQQLWTCSKHHGLGGSALCTCFLLVPDASLTGVKLWLILQPRKTTTATHPARSSVYDWLLYACLIVLDFVCKATIVLQFLWCGFITSEVFRLRILPSPSLTLAHHP